MKKKIDYNKIPKKILNVVLGDDYFNGDYTLKDELDKYGQDIIAHRYKLNEDGSFEFFHAWSKDHTFCLVYGAFSELLILGLNRNPPND